MLHPKFAILIAFVILAIVSFTANGPIIPFIVLLLGVAAAIAYNKYYKEKNSK